MTLQVTNAGVTQRHPEALHQHIGNIAKVTEPLLNTCCQFVLTPHKNIAANNRLK